jgi:hypothetical protein
MSKKEYQIETKLFYKKEASYCRLLGLERTIQLMFEFIGFIHYYSDVDSSRFDMFCLFLFYRKKKYLENADSPVISSRLAKIVMSKHLKQRRMAWGIQGRIKMAAGCSQGTEWWGMAGPRDTLGSPWIPHHGTPMKYGPVQSRTRLIPRSGGQY